MKILEILNKPLTRKVREDALITFFRQLGTLVKAGIPLYQSLLVVSEQTSDKRLQDILKKFRGGLEEGKSLSENMGDYQEVFSSFTVSTVSVGEAKGALGDALGRVAKQLVKVRDLKNKVVAALLYPALLVGVGIVVLIVMALFVLPKFITIFEEMEVSLPAPTRAVVFVNQFLGDNFFLLLVAIVLFVGGLFYAKGTSRGKMFLDSFVLKIPLVGNVLTSAYSARFGSTFGALYSGGIPLLEALRLTSAVFGNVVWREDIVLLGQRVRSGESFSSAVSKIKCFPTIMKQMLSVGAESSAIDTLAIEAASFYEEETENLLQKQLALLEPLALILIAIVVAFMAAAVLLPMFSMSSGIRTS